MQRPCLEPGCPMLVKGPKSRCVEHMLLHHQHDRERRGTAVQRGYDRTWIAIRNGYAHQHPLCEDCQERGLTVAMQLVDHVIPLPHGPRLDPKNLRSLCRSCHTAKTLRDKAQGYEANTAQQPEEHTPWIVR